MNNKGQSLVLFVLILPILLGIIVLVVDVGRAINEKITINNKIELVITYGLEDNLSKEKIEELVNYNLENSINKVTLENNVITINTSTYVEGIISNIVGFKGFNIESQYKGYIENNKNIIKKVK